MNDGGPAFPSGEKFSIDGNGRRDDRVMQPLHTGLTLRDYFAAKALIAYGSSARVMDKAFDDWTENGGPRDT